MASLDLDKLKATKKITLAGDPLCIAPVPNSDQLWFGSSDFKVYFVDLATDTILDAGTFGSGIAPFVLFVVAENPIVIYSLPLVRHPCTPPMFVAKSREDLHEVGPFFISRIGDIRWFPYPHHGAETTSIIASHPGDESYDIIRGD